MSIFDDNITNDLPNYVKVREALQEVVNIVTDRVNNHFGECQLIVNPWGSIQPASTHASFWHELDKELELLGRRNDKYKKYEKLNIYVTARNLIHMTENDQTTKYEFSLVTLFDNEDIHTCHTEIQFDTEINNVPNWP